MIPQEQHLQHILDLKRDNPEMEIKFCVNSDEIYEYGFTVHQINDVRIMPWYQIGEKILNEEVFIMDYFLSKIPMDISDDEAERLARIEYKKEVKNAICVFTQAV